MKSKLLIHFIIFTLISCHSNSQNQDVNGVKSTLKSYINAGDINSEEELKPHLHNDFRVVLYDSEKDETSILDKSTYVSFIKTKKFGGYKREASFEEILFVENNMATVKVTLTSPGKPTLKNFYSMVKIRGSWLVIQDYVVLVP